MSAPTKTISAGGLNINNASQSAENIIIGRDAFVTEYCAAKGWDRNELTIEQIMQIRQQDGWKNPTLPS